MVHLDLQQSSRSSDEAREEAGWLAWNTLRCLCEQNAQLSVCLEITAELPEEVVLQRWLGEPIKSAIINTDVRKPEARRKRETERETAEKN
jgi:protein arginine N-methyltransferase 5